MPDIVYSTGPIEQEFGVNQLRLKALNNSTSTANVTVTIYDLNGTKTVFNTYDFTIDPGASDFAIVDIPDFAQFEVQFAVSNFGVQVGVFAVKTTFSAANSVRHGEMVIISGDT